MKIIPITPVPKPRMNKADRWKKRPVVERYWRYKDLLVVLAPKDIDWEKLSITFVIPMPKSWSEKKRNEMNGSCHKQKPDLNNLVKGFEDCLLVEDSHIWMYNKIRKLWGYDGEILVKTKETP